MQLFLTWLATLTAFIALDALWLMQMGPGIYRDVLGAQMRPAFDPAPAAVFYLIYSISLVVLAIMPALERGHHFRAAAAGALLGLAAYATYDLSNQATLRFWEWRLTLVDMAWGTFASATASLAGFQVATFLSRA